MRRAAYDRLFLLSRLVRGSAWLPGGMGIFEVLLLALVGCGDCRWPNHVWPPQMKSQEALLGSMDEIVSRLELACLHPEIDFYYRDVEALIADWRKRGEALKPFARVAQYEDDRSDPANTLPLDDDDDYWSVFYLDVRARHFRAARDALGDNK